MEVEQTVPQGATRSVTSVTVKQSCCSHVSSYQVRIIKSKGAILILFWFAMLWSFWTTKNILVPAAFQNSIWYQRVFPHLNYVFVYPLAGWLADVKFGRYNVMHTSLWLMWGGALASSVVTVVQSGTHSVPTGVSTAVLVVTNIFMFCGFAGFYVNVIPFGTDQLLEATSREVSAFIHWLIWVWYAGIFVGRVVFGSDLLVKCTLVKSETIQQIFIPFPLLSLTLALCSDYVLRRGWLNMEPNSQNPLKTVMRVLKYAASHKQPERRSAFTYWEDLPPQRIDFGKTKYGGPFTTEEVEDVKTVVRILVVVLCAAAFLIASNNSAYYFYEDHFRFSTNLPSCLDAVTSLGYSYHFFVVVSIPIYELLIYPFFQRWTPSMLKRLGLGIVAALVCSVLLFTADTAGHAQHRSVPCKFTANSSSPTLNIGATWITVVFNIFSALYQMLYFIAGYEFICAQSPYNMKGLLFGCYYSMRGIFQLLADVWYVGWTYGYRNIGGNVIMYPSCGSWYYLSTTVIGVLGLVAFCLVAKWYKKREREEPANERLLVEAYYDKYVGRAV